MGSARLGAFLYLKREEEPTSEMQYPIKIKTWTESKERRILD
jgi:hypothetical protein